MRADDPLVTRFSVGSLSGEVFVERPKAKSSPLIERNDAMLWAKANTAGGKSARASPLILEESEGLAALAACATWTSLKRSKAKSVGK